MKVVVRVDDVGWKPPEGEDRQDNGLDLFHKFHAAMSGVPFLAAVIPACLDDAGRQWLESKPAGLTVGMHGVDHQREGGNCGEFSWLQKEQVVDRVKLGLSLMPAGVEHFVAPWNDYGEHLHDVLALAGVKYHWTEPEYSENPSWIERKQDYSIIPAWAPLYGCIAWPSGPGQSPMLERIPEIMKREGRAVLTLHITWEASRGGEFTGVQWLVANYRHLILTPEEYLS